MAKVQIIMPVTLDGFLPDNLMAEDGIHATAECGAMMIAAMREQGLLAA